MRDGLPADPADKDALVPAAEVVEEEEFFVLEAHGADHVLVHDIRAEEGRQAPRADDLFLRLFDVLQNIANGVGEGVRRQGLEVGAAEAVVEVGVLTGGLFSAGAEAVIALSDHLAGHGAVGDEEEAVEVQPPFFGAAFPDAHVPPALPAAEIPQGDPQLLPEALLRMEAVVVGKGCKVILWIL